MNELERPLFFEKNRVRRIYTGGAQFAEFFNDNSEEGYYPEEWIASVVKAINEGSTIYNEGISRLENGEYFNEIIEKHTKEMLGAGRDRFGVLVKMLDSSIRLPVQVHPDKEFSHKYFHSNFGKTESWVILGTGKDACIYFGFNGSYTKEQLIEAFATDDESKLLSMLNRIPVKVGDVFLIPGKAVHAIGKNCLLLEVQEPTDFTIQPENRCGDYVLSDNEKYIGLSENQAFECFDMSLAGLENSLKHTKCIPQKCGDVEKLITYNDTPCFAVNRYSVDEKEVNLPAPAIYVAVSGTGELKCEDYKRIIKKGDYFFAPSCIDGKLSVNGDKLKLIQCCLPEVKE